MRTSTAVKLMQSVAKTSVLELIHDTSAQAVTVNDNCIGGSNRAACHQHH